MRSLSSDQRSHTRVFGLNWSLERAAHFVLPLKFFERGDRTLKRNWKAANEPTSLQKKFDSIRSEMVSLGMELGLNHPSVIRLSQELDQVHNQILRSGNQK